MEISICTDHRGSHYSGSIFLFICKPSQQIRNPPAWLFQHLHWKHERRDGNLSDNDWAPSATGLRLPRTGHWSVLLEISSDNYFSTDIYSNSVTGRGGRECKNLFVDGVKESSALISWFFILKDPLISLEEKMESILIFWICKSNFCFIMENFPALKTLDWIFVLKIANIWMDCSSASQCWHSS